MVFAMHQHESATGTHVSPHPEPPSHYPPHPIPLTAPEPQLPVLCLMRQICTGHLFYIG